MISYPRSYPWIGLTLILICFVLLVIREHPTNYFGLTADDAVYFSSAKALAQGKGYILANMPETPPATKYPILYSWILSWVWRLNGSFPANLTDATAITVVFGLAFITLSFIFLRGLRGINSAESLLITALCALHPRIIFFSGSIMSDIPFAAMALAAMLLADRAMRPQARGTMACSSGILAVLSMLTRLTGIAVVAGILVTAIARRAWRPLFFFCGCVTPFFAVMVWRLIHTSKSQVSAVYGNVYASSLGWTRMWAYYTSYTQYWRLSVPSGSIFWAMLWNNMNQIVYGISDYFLSPLLVGDAPASRALSTIVTAAIVVGLVRQARRQEVKCAYYVLPFSIAVIALWNYPITERNLLLFLPLFSAGLWIEVKHVFGMLRTVFVVKASTSKRALAGSIGVCILALGGGVAWNYLAGTRTIMAGMGADRVALLDEKRQVYDWITQFTPPSSRIIAYEDASVYLYTGRMSMPPIVFTTAELYEPARLDQTLDHLFDVAGAIRADYWLVSDDDFDREWPLAAQKAHERMAELGRNLPLAFRSRGGRVSIYSLECMKARSDPTCRQ